MGQEFLERGITAKERIIIHLKDHWNFRDEMECPFEITQAGISENTGLTLSHIPRNIKKMKDEGLVVEGKAYVKGKSRRYKVYHPTQKGLKLGRSLIKEIGKTSAIYNDESMLVLDILKMEKEPAMAVLASLLGESSERSVTRKKKLGYHGNIPDTDGFVDRTEELEELNDLFSSDVTKLIMIYGSQGYGTSMLASKFIKDIGSQWNCIIWVDIKKKLDDTLEQLYSHLTASGLDGITKEMISDPHAIISYLADKKMVIVFDGYFDVGEASVEYFFGLVEKLKEVNGLKMIVTAREDTASYNRFYTIMDIHDSSVQEIHVKRMDMTSCRALLGVNDLEDDALRRLYAFTRGSPSIMKTLASNDINYIEERTSFSREEIKLMLHLKTLRIDN